MSPKIKQNFHEDCEAFINKQTNMEFYASFVYLSMVRTPSVELGVKRFDKYCVMTIILHTILLVTRSKKTFFRKLTRNCSIKIS